MKNNSALFADISKVKVKNQLEQMTFKHKTVKEKLIKVKTEMEQEITDCEKEKSLEELLSSLGAVNKAVMTLQNDVTELYTMSHECLIS